MHRASVLYLHTRSFFTSELYACTWFDGYLGGGNPGGTGFRDENVGRRRGRLHCARRDDAPADRDGAACTSIHYIHRHR